MAKSTKVHVKIPDEIMIRVLRIATEEYHGNVSQYIRVALFEDMFRRQILTHLERDLLQHLES